MCFIFSIFKGINILKKVDKNNKMIGICKFKVNNNQITIYNLFVKLEHRNKKIGSNLIKNVECFGINNNLKSIKLLTYLSDNGTNIEKFYIKNGYKKFNDIIDKPQYYDDGECLYDLFQFKKNIY